MMDFFYNLFGTCCPAFTGPGTKPYSILIALLKLSLPACILIAAVLLARQLLRKAPKWISCALWALVALRLLCPFTIEAPFSVMPNDVGSGKAVDVWMDRYVPGGYAVIHEGEPGYDEAVGSDRLPVQSKDGIRYVVTGVGTSPVPETIGDRILPYLFYAWGIGMAAMFLYAAVSYLRLKRRTAVTVSCARGVVMCDEIDSPFILGVVRPRIFLPSGMTEPQLSRVLAHERAHLKRRDHWWKPLGYLLLCVYWFNPLVWVAYVLLNRDIEMACDARVVRDMDAAERADYAQTLLDCSRPRRVIAACPLAFGEVGVKERVRSVLRYKKPAVWSVAVAVAVCIVLAGCLMTNPAQQAQSDPAETAETAALRDKYPEYFDLPTFKGLELYVWQMTPDSYACGLMPGTNREKTPAELMDLKGASIAEMRMILSTYAVDAEDVFIIPWQNPVSSYIAEYWISQEDEDPAALEKRRQAYVDGIRQMLFGPAQNESADAPDPSAEIKTAVAYANWSMDPQVFACLNAEKMIISAVRHLPVYKIDAAEDLQRFRETFREILTLDHGYDEIPAFDEIAAAYDDSFFADHTLVLAYVTASSGSFRYEIRDIAFDGSALCLNVTQTNHPEVYTADMAGWLVVAEIPDAVLTDITEFDAILQS